MRRGSWPTSGSVALAAACAGAGVDACPCGPAATAVTTLTTPDERVALRANVSAMAEPGTWDDRARAWPAPEGVRTRRLLVELAAAWRPWRRVELVLASGVGLTAADQPGVAVRAVSLGDVMARARWDALDHVAWRAALGGGVRAPVGDAVAGTIANGVPGLGLGVWELAAGGEIARRDGALGELGVAAEVGVRLPTEGASGRAWTPGPRLSATLFGAWRVTSTFTWTASVNHVWELDAWRDGQRVADSGARRVTAATGVSLRVGASVTWSAALAVDPWLDGLGANATAAVRGTLGVTWSHGR